MTLAAPAQGQGVKGALASKRPVNDNRQDLLSVYSGDIDDHLQGLFGTQINTAQYRLELNAAGTAGTITRYDHGKFTAKFQFAGRMESKNVFVGTDSLESGPPEWMQGAATLRHNVRLEFSTDKSIVQITYAYIDGGSAGATPSTGTLKLTGKVANPTPKIAVGQTRGPLNQSAALLGDGSSASPDANAVQACVAQIQAAHQCAQGVRIRGVNQVDRRVTPTDATVIVDVDFTVVASFAGTSGTAETCTGTAWDMDPSKVRSEAVEQMPFGVPLPGGSNHFIVGQGLRVRKSFTFQKFESGWRCMNQSMQPVDAGYYLAN